MWKYETFSIFFLIIKRKKGKERKRTSRNIQLNSLIRYYHLPLSNEIPYWLFVFSNVSKRPFVTIS